MKKKTHAQIRTRSIRIQAGARSNKPKFGTPKRKRGVPWWMVRDNPNAYYYDGCSIIAHFNPSNH